MKWVYDKEYQSSSAWWLVEKFNDGPWKRAAVFTSESSLDRVLRVLEGSGGRNRHMSDELQCSKCGLVSDRERRSLADDPQAVERARKAAEPYALLSGLEMQEVLRAAEGDS